MAISLLMPDGLALTAQQERQAKAPQHGGGSGRPLGGRSGFRVGTPSNILTATSTTWTLGACAIEIDPGAAVDQGMYGWANSANTSGAMTAADSTYARKDIVYIQINDPTSGDGTGSLSYAPQYLAGPADGTNAPPSLPPRSFLVGTITVPAAAGGSPSVVRNPATYVAAGAPLPVSSQAERDALSAYDGLTVRRMDLAGRPTETFNGTGWRSPVEAAAVVTDGNWSATGQVTRALSPDGQSMATIGERMLRTGASFTLTTSYLPILPGFIPSGFRPASMFNGWALLTNAVDNPVATMWWRINAAGDLEARLDGGSVLLDTGHRFNLSGNWTPA